MTTNFDPLTSEIKTPLIARSLDTQRKFLAKLGLHEVTKTNDRGQWITVERVVIEKDNGPTLCKHGVNVQGNRSDPVLCQLCDDGSSSVAQTHKEANKYADHLNSLVYGEARIGYIPITGADVLRLWGMGA